MSVEVRSATEATPLSPQSTSQQNYTTKRQESPASEHSTSSSDSEAGYVSGSGRRSAYGESKASSRKASPSSRRKPVGSSEYVSSPIGSPGMRIESFGSRSKRSQNTTIKQDDSVRRRISQTEGQDAPSRRASRRSLRPNADEANPDSDVDSWAWFRNLAEKYGAVELDNKGSVARDHLALERTFLAWLRTSLAFASIGIAVTQLFRLNSTLKPHELETESPLLRLRTVGKPLGATFLGVAILILLIGWRRYFESQYWIIRGKFPASRGSVFLVTLVAAALIMVSLVVVVAFGRVA